MKIKMFLLVIPFAFLALVTCAPSARSPEGIYHMLDFSAMRNFIGYPEIPDYAYCMEFRPSKDLARVRFLEGPSVYELKVEKMGPEVFLFKGPKGSRIAKIVSRRSMPGNFWQIHIHFEDSSPYKPGPNSPYDGGKDPSWKTLDDCVQAQLKHLKEAEEQSYPTPDQIERDKKDIPEQEKQK